MAAGILNSLRRLRLCQGLQAPVLGRCGVASRPPFPTETRDEDELESDWEKDEEQDIIRAMKRHQKAVRYRRIQREMEPPGPPERRLTWNAIEQIRYLKQEFPEEWTVQRLAVGFNVSTDAIRRVLKSKFIPPEKRKMKQDIAVSRILGQISPGSLVDQVKSMAAPTAPAHPLQLQGSNEMKMLSAQSSPRLPAQSSPRLPAQSSPRLPAQSSPRLPAQSSPRLPAQSSPRLPAQSSPRLPAQSSPRLPAQSSPRLPAQSSPRLPAQSSPHLPAQSSPRLPAQSSPRLPAQSSPRLPAQSSPHIPTPRSRDSSQIALRTENALQRHTKDTQAPLPTSKPQVPIVTNPRPSEPVPTNPPEEDGMVPEESWDGEVLSDYELEELAAAGLENKMKVVQSGSEFFDSDGNFLYRL